MFAPKRVVLICALAGAALAALVIALRWRSIVESYVTSAAIADAREKLAKRQRSGKPSDREFEAKAGELAREWQAWFESGYFDRSMLLGKMASGKDALEALLVLVAYYHALDREDEQFIAQEIARWLGYMAESSPAKDLLVDALVGDIPWMPPNSDDAPEATKLVFFTAVFAPEKDDPLYQGLSFPYLEIENWSELEQRVLTSISQSAWRSIVRDTSAPREKTRAGALLLLYRHPDPGVFQAAARRALSDSSQLVRLAAAGTLAIKGIDAGEGILVEGMSHERWEIRFWCLHAIRALGKDTPVLIQDRLKEEKDPWLVRLLRKEPHDRTRKSINGLEPVSEE